MKKTILIIVSILIIIIVFFAIKNYNSCKWCISDKDTFVIESRNVFKTAIARNELEGTILFCKDSADNDSLNLEGREDLNYFVEFRDNKIIKLVVYDSKYVIEKENVDGINVEDISNQDFENDYDVSQIKCN